MPEELHLEALRSNGPAPGEQLQPEDAQPAAAPATAAAAAARPEPDAGIVAQLVSMGFSENGSKRAGKGWPVNHAQVNLGRVTTCPSCDKVCVCTDQPGTRHTTPCFITDTHC